MQQEHDIVYERQHGTTDTRLPTHVLQSVYNSLKILRWYLVHYPTIGVQAPDMSEIIWEIMCVRCHCPLLIANLRDINKKLNNGTVFPKSKIKYVPGWAKAIIRRNFRCDYEPKHHQVC